MNKVSQPTIVIFTSIFKPSPTQNQQLLNNKYCMSFKKSSKILYYSIIITNFTTHNKFFKLFTAFHVIATSVSQPNKISEATRVLVIPV